MRTIKQDGHRPFPPILYRLENRDLARARHSIEKKDVLTRGLSIRAGGFMPVQTFLTENRSVGCCTKCRDSSMSPRVAARRQSVNQLARS